MADRTNIDYAVTEGRAEIALDRPDVYNAFTPEMLVDLNEVILEAMTDDDVYALVLTGRGDGFCSGADVTGMDGRDDRRNKFQYSAHLWKVQYVDRLLYFGLKPTVAAVNGPAVGAGSDFALACDFRVMSAESFLRPQFVNIGLVPGDGGGWLLPRLVGESKAKEYLMSGRDIDPDAADGMGLVVDVVPDGDALSAARELANELQIGRASCRERVYSGV
jgi:enoyl-CoA hydratase/carnithine racemase